MQATPGSYALLFHCSKAVEVAVGSLGRLQLEPGYYIYLGSAFGPGGVKARTNHHRRICKKPHWHLDYLRPFLHLIEIWYSHDTKQREHQWANQISILRGVRQPFVGFGASDCDCSTHFFWIGYKPSFSGFRQRMRKVEPEHDEFFREYCSTD